MQLLEAHMDRVRFTVRRRSPRLVAFLLTGAVAFVGSGALALLLVGSSLAGRAGPEPMVVPPAIDCPAPSGEPALEDTCAALVPTLADAPTLFEAYLARRHHHLTALLPVAFPPTDAPLPRLARQWSVGSEADRALIASIVRDATREDTEWAMRDPIVGARSRLGGRMLDDDAVRATMAQWVPRRQPLPDRAGATIEELVEQRVVRDEGAGRALFAAPEADEVVDRAVADVRRYDALRRVAFHTAIEVARGTAAVSNARLAEAGAAEVRSRNQLLAACIVAELLLAGWVAASVGVSLWALRRQHVVIGFDGHGLRIGGQHLPWDDVVDLNWYEGRVQWTTTRGDGVVRGLALSESEARAFHRVCWTLRNRRGSDPADAQADALASLRGLVASVNRR